jgi:D-alanyl-D-alanine carboxypeptidase
MVNGMSPPRLALLLTVALIAVATAPAPAPAADGLRPALDRIVDAGAPGALAVAGGRAAAVGVADVRTGRPLRPRARLRIGSITKSFTAALALRLVGERRLRLTDTVGELLPGVLPAADRVTLRQLLNHTSGVPDDVASVLVEIFHGDPLRRWTPAEMIGLVRDEPLRFAPGAGWAYSNTDYVLAGLMIERVTGHRLARELELRILRPLRLHDTSFPMRAGGLGARGYSLELGPDGPLPGALRDITRYSPSFGWASGNGISTARDVARFYRALLRGRLLRPRLLSAALDVVPTGRPGRGYGLGLDVYETSHGTLVGHDGDVPGFSVKALSTRDGRRQAVVAANAKFGPPAVEEALDGALDVAMRRHHP